LQWAFSNSIFEGPKESGISIVNTALYWNDIMDAVDAKRNAGYDASLTDYWGRALSYQLINDTDGGPAYTWSSIADDQNFKDAIQPMPIIVADGRIPGTTIISLNTTVYEFNPWEMGSFDPTVFGFVPQKYLGSNFSNGVIPTDQRCMSGFDQYGYVMGTSSSLFNQLIQQNLTSSGMPQALVSILQGILSDLGTNNDDIASYDPNPFLGWNANTNENAAQKSLTLVDGGEDLQNIPLHPLIQPERDVDVIFAVDSSADTTYAWPNGTALRATWERSREAISNGTQFPAVPDAETFINLGLNRRPTFFGCDEANFTRTNAAAHVPPLVVYVPNTPYTAWSNATTLTMSYSDSKRNNIIENGVNVATMGNGTLAGWATWRTCAGCAILKRSLYKTNTSVPAACQACFAQYCWNGTVDSTPVASFEPLPYLTLEAESAAAGLARPTVLAGVLGMAGVLVLAW
jgi:lysophospholipase